jgi:hypothetical protein
MLYRKACIQFLFVLNKKNKCPVSRLRGGLRTQPKVIMDAVSHPLKIPLFRQRDAAFVTHHHMIQYSCADHVQNVLEGGGQRAVGLAGRAVARCSIVDQDNGRSVVSDSIPSMRSRGSAQSTQTQPQIRRTQRIFG